MYTLSLSSSVGHFLLQKESTKHTSGYIILNFTTLAYFQQERTPKNSLHGCVPEVHKQRKLALMVLDVLYLQCGKVQSDRIVVGLEAKV